VHFIGLIKKILTILTIFRKKSRKLQW